MFLFVIPTPSPYIYGGFTSISVHCMVSLPGQILEINHLTLH